MTLEQIFQVIFGLLGCLTAFAGLLVLVSMLNDELRGLKTLFVAPLFVWAILDFLAAAQMIPIWVPLIPFFVGAGMVVVLKLKK